LFALLAILLAFGALVVAADAMSNSEDAKAVAAVGGSAAKVTLSEFKIDPAMVDVSSGGSIAVANGGTVEHNLGVKGTDLKTRNLKPGESDTLDLSSLKDGTYTLYCEIPGHEGAGMKASLMLGTMGAGSGGASTAAAEAALTAADTTNNAAMQKEMQEYVGQLDHGPLTQGVGNQPLAPTVLPDGTKQFDLTAKIVDWEVAPGNTVRAWTYNGQVPGPLISVSSGDHVRIVVKNELPQSTAVHFHGIETPNAMDGVPYITQDPVLPGHTFTYEFVAHGPAVGMYHSHHYAVGQVSNGMAGTFLIDGPPTPPGYGPISQRVPMVLNDAGVIGFSLNGKSFPATAPIVTKVGETVAIDYLNEGQQIHPMHLHGVPQLVVAKDGFPLPQPYLADTVQVAPGERYTVLIKPTAEQKGVWAYHCHILSHAEHEDGMMFGMVTALIVQ
jgi:FtsP/CotA-like multicopper oxidase with cupredoxin domain